MRFCPGRAIEIHLHSQDRERRDIKHKISMVQDTRKPNYGSQESFWFHIWFTMTLYYKMRQKLLQNATLYFIAKYDKNLLQNALTFLLQNITILLQNATVFTECDVYYKMRRYNDQGHIFQ